MGTENLDSGRRRSKEIPETGGEAEPLCKTGPLRNKCFWCFFV